MSGMSWYIARRLIWTVFVAWIAISVTWGLVEMSPRNGELNAAVSAAQAGGDVEEAREDYLKRQGLDRPWHVRYVEHVQNMFTFNFGYSDFWDQRVAELLIDKYPYSVQYGAPVAIMTVILGYSLGLYSAMHQYELSDSVATFIAFFGLSIPNFWFGIMLILLVGVWFQDLVIQLGPVVFDFIALPFLYDPDIPKTQGFVSFANFKQLILPMIVLTTAALAGHMRYSRSYALEYANSEFVKTARAKGAGGTRVLTKHILRVALVPLMTIFVFDVISIFLSSSLIIEQIFQIPGLGLVTYKSFINQDTPVILANTLLGVFVALIGYLLQDIAYVALDPRINYGDRTGGGA